MGVNSGRMAGVISGGSNTMTNLGSHVKECGHPGAIDLVRIISLRFQKRNTGAVGLRGRFKAWGRDP